VSFRRALVVGCVARDLPGVAESVAAMADLLRDVHGFEVCVLVGPDATTQNILDAFLALHRVTEEGDVVVFYYAGHGTVFHAPPRGDRGEIRVDLIKGADFATTEVGDFHGLLGSALSRLIRALMGRTANVTVLLDCCNAADLVRPFDVGLDRASSRRYAAELERAISRRVRRSAVTVRDDGPRAVIVMASASGTRSYFDPERKILLFTEQLLDRLATRERAAECTWQEHVAAVRQALRERDRGQLPGVAGARFRLPFQTEVGVPGPSFFLVSHTEEGPSISTGKAAGIEPGDAFELFTFGWRAERHGVKIGLTTATAVDGTTLLARPDQPAQLPTLLYARRVVTRRHPLALELDVAAVLGVEDPFPDWYGTDTGAIATLRWSVDGTVIEVADLSGDTISRVKPSHPAALAEVRAGLARAARWASIMRALDSGGLPVLEDFFSYRWGKLCNDSKGQVLEEPFAEHATIHAGKTAVFMRLESGVMKLYARVYRIGGDRNIEPWTDSHDGISVDLGHSGQLAADSAGEARSIVFAWPAALPDAPAGSCVAEWALLLVSDAVIPRDLIPSDEPAAAPVRRTRGGARYTYRLLPYRLEKT